METNTQTELSPKTAQISSSFGGGFGLICGKIGNSFNAGKPVANIRKHSGGWVMKAPTILTNGKIDIHQRAKYIAWAKEAVQKAPISSRNKELILTYARDCELGKTIKNKSKKRIGELRVAKYILALKTLALWLGKDFDKAQQADIEELILALEKDEHHKKNGEPFRHNTKLDFKKTLRKFYKWLLGNNEHFPDIVSWIDLEEKDTEIPALTESEARRASSSAMTLRDRTLLLFMFDSGARAEELLNIRLKDVTKGEDAFIVRIAFSKTKARTISVPLCTEILQEYLYSREKGRGQQTNTAEERGEEQLFPLTYEALRMVVARNCLRAGITKNVTPHVFRHSSATFYANRLSYAQLCNRYGWSFSSNMPNRYIDRNGLNELQTVKIIKAETTAQLNEENSKLKLEVSFLKQHLNDVDTLLVKLLKGNPSLLSGMREAVKANGLEHELRRLI